MKGTIRIAAWLVAMQSAVCLAVDITPKHRYEGMDSVTAAVALSEDMFIACSSEDNVLRVYHTEGSPAPIARLDVSNFLGLDGDSADIRGATKIADCVYWITSHSRDEEGRIRPGRYRFFATTVRKEDDRISIEPVGRPCTALLNKLPTRNTVSTLRLDKAMQLDEKRRQELAPMREGLNIETLCADPRVDILFIGFRNPRPVRVITGRPHALVIPLNNASEVVEGKGPIFGEAMLWDFDGLGITCIEHSPAHGACFILAQPHNDTGPCVLYRWSGMKANPPEQVRRLRLASKEATTVRLVAFNDSHKLLLLTACGECAEATPEDKHFHGIWIQP